MDIKKTIDAKGLACPMPMVRTKKAIDELASGEVLEVFATDKGSRADITMWAKMTGHEMLECSEEGSVFTFRIRKG